jgi:hypothetical protein
MKISKARLRREVGHIIDHLSEHPERDFEDLHAVLVGASKISVKLTIADELLHGHGIERLAEDRGGGSPRLHASYVNTGDTYGLTLLYDHCGAQFHFTTYGDWVERWERRLPKAQRESNVNLMTGDY